MSATVGNRTAVLFCFYIFIYQLFKERYRLQKSICDLSFEFATEIQAAKVSILHKTTGLTRRKRGAPSSGDAAS